MTSRASHKQRGSRFEVELRDWFRSRQYDSERLARAGKDDEGDVSVKGVLGFIGIIEAKAPGAGNKIDLSGWAKEARTEANQYGKANQNRGHPGTRSGFQRANPGTHRSRNVRRAAQL